jgi:general secretion pathway protein A
MRAAREVFGKGDLQRPPRRIPSVAVATAVLILCVAVLTGYYMLEHETVSISEPEAVQLGNMLEHETVSISEPETVQLGNIAEARLEVPQLATLSWPSEHFPSGSEDVAYEVLFRQWDAIYDHEKNVPVCVQALTEGLGCFEKRGSLGSLRRLNRPAVLKLINSEEREFHVTITKLYEDRATFAVGDERGTVALRELSDQWFGQYTMLWRKPPGYEREIQPGDQGPVVEWLRSQLALLYEGAEESENSSLFDDALLKTVKQFQIARGLIPDGIVGPQTIVHLNTAVGLMVPRLIGKEEQS